MNNVLTYTRLFRVLALSAVTLLGAMAAGLAWGSSSASAFDIFGDHNIVWIARAPRVIFAAAVGAALAISGSVFQAVLRNPLADPYILGISGGAALGAV
ncbi:MAG: iron chelate uptake ABC transporter family permease subunit [bacterium]